LTDSNKNSTDGADNFPALLENLSEKKEILSSDSTDALVEQSAAVSAFISAETPRQALEAEAAILSECLIIASDIYKIQPNLDNAYQITSLAQTHNQTLSLLNRIRDPRAQVVQIEILVKGFLTQVIRAMMLEMDRTKRDLIQRHPEEKTAIEDHFSRMVSAIQPETQRLYDGFYDSITSALGIRKKKP
jgi:hypothetical protein